MTSKEIDIEIQVEEQPEDTGLQLPQNFLTLGEIAQDDAQVYIKQSTYKALEKLAASDTSKELGSILIGEYTQETNRVQVVISDYIEAKYTDASSATLTFTHETWDYVHKQHDKRFPEKKIIGWQHTHPNYGIFLSNYDMFIQENFFNLPFQIAYVIDPVQNLRGFFQWKDGKVEKLKGFHIYDDLGKPIKIEQTKVEKKQEVQIVEQKPSRRPSVLTWLMCLLCIILAIQTFILQGKYDDLLRSHESVKSHMVGLNTVDANQLTTIEKLQSALNKSETTSKELGTTIENLNGVVQADKDKLNAQDAQIQQLQTQLEELRKQLEDQANQEDQNDKNYMRFIGYTVVAGDSLVEICKAHGINYESTYQIILAINGIEDENKIYVGQTILLPVSE